MLSVTVCDLMLEPPDMDNSEHPPRSLVKTIIDFAEDFISYLGVWLDDGLTLRQLRVLLELEPGLGFVEVRIDDSSEVTHGHH